MLRSFLRRSRVIALLLAFGLGLAGNLAWNAALASQMQAPMQHDPTTGGTMCPGCAGDSQQGMMGASCSPTACWTAPALPAQGTAPQPWPPIAFTPSVSAILTGIPTGPDPHPPRPSLHA